MILAKPRPAVSVGDLVRTGLLKAAAAGESRLTGKNGGLFVSSAGANKEAIGEKRGRSGAPLVDKLDERFTRGGSALGGTSIYFEKRCY